MMRALVVIIFVLSCLVRMRCEEVRVAGCMSGGIRSLFHPSIQDNIKFQVLDPLKLDLIMFVGYEYNYVDHSLFESKEKMEESFQKIVEKLKPVKVETYDVTNIPRPTRDQWKEVAPCWTYNLRGKATRPPRNMWPQFWGELRIDFENELRSVMFILCYISVELGVQHCYNMLKEYEEEKGFQYDWVVRLRPDIVYAPPGRHSFNEKAKISLPTIPSSTPLSSLSSIWAQAYYRLLFGWLVGNFCG